MTMGSKEGDPCFPLAPRRNTVHLSGAAFAIYPENGSLISSPPWVSMAWAFFIGT